MLLIVLALCLKVKNTNEEPELKELLQKGGRSEADLFGLLKRFRYFNKLPQQLVIFAYSLASLQALPNPPK